MGSTSIKCDIFGECRSKTNCETCKNGTFFYRCGNLNTERYYSRALEVATSYSFDQLNFRPRDNWDFYKERVKNEDKGEACQDCRKEDEITEAFECRCAYLCGNGKCAKGGKDKIWGGSKFEILYYQLPISKDYSGKVDLVLWEKGTKNIFLTEYKPNRTQSPERLLRMICEIVTYRSSATQGCLQFFNEKFKDKRFKEKIVSIAEENIHTAIMFNEFGDDKKSSSPQKAEYEKKNATIEALLKKHHVCVFELKESRDIIMLEDNRVNQ